jgi:hypothetical protein
VVAFVREPPNARPYPWDWTAALDDLLCERWRRCTLCGGTPLAYAHIQDQPTGLALSLVLCGPCHRLGEATYAARLQELFMRRYGIGSPS